MIKGVNNHFDEREAVAEILDEIKSGERTVELEITYKYRTFCNK